MCSAQHHFILLTLLNMFMTFILSLTQVLVFLPLYMMLSMLLSMVVCKAASLSSVCLVSVHVCATYVIASSTL